MLSHGRIVVLGVLIFVNKPRVITPICVDRQCTTYFQETKWNMTSSSCVGITLPSRSLCAIKCFQDFDCLLFKFACETNCVCQICQDIISFDMTLTDTSYLRRRKVYLNPPMEPLWLNGGLHVGHLSEISIKCEPDVLPDSLFIQFLLGTESKEDNFKRPLEIMLDSRDGKTDVHSLFVPGVGVTNGTEPLFPYKLASEVRVVIFLDPEKFNIFINGALYSTLAHSNLDFGQIQYIYRFLVPPSKGTILNLSINV